MITKIYRHIVLLLKQSEKLSAASCRLVQWTHKHDDPIHPKHLIQIRSPWYLDYVDKESIVLDIGCNNGQHTIKIAAYCKQVFAFDYDPRMLKLALNHVRRSGYSNVIIQQADAESRLPYHSSKFHRVVFLDVLEHLNNRDKIMQEIYRVLKPAGLLLLSIPNRNTHWKLVQKNLGINYYSDPDHKVEYSDVEIKNFLKENGFKVQNIFPVTLDTPLVGLIDLIGGISLTLYKYLSQWRRTMAQKYPKETIGYELVCVKK